MKLWSRITSVLRNLFLKQQVENQLDDELHAYVDMLTDEKIAAGMSASEALRTAQAEFGGVEPVKQAVRDRRAGTGAELLWQDVRYATRQFRRAPGYALFTVLVLALGIGTVTAMFTITYAVLLKPLPFTEDNQLFQPVKKTTKSEENLNLPYDEIKEWQRATNGTADVGFNRGGLNIADGPAGAVLITEVEASPNLFSLLGTRPIMGRSFLREDQETDHPDTVVLSYALWQQNFSGDPGVLGKTIHIGGMAHKVIGVMPAQFRYPVYEDRPEAWVPLDRSDQKAGNNDPYAYYDPIVRLHAGTSVKEVETQLAQVHRRFAKSKESEIRLAGLRDLLVADVRPALLALEVAVGVVWLIACSNVAGLLLARVAARRTEIAVRSALGAGRGRIFAQFLTESLVLSCAGAAGGLALAVLMLRMFRGMLSKTLPLSASIQLNWAVWTGLVVLTVLTALAFGMFPAILAARADIDAGLKNGGRQKTGDRGQNRARAVLLVGEVALSITLLIGAGLMMRTMYALRHVPLGFTTDHLVLTSLTMPNDLYKERNVGSAVWQPLLEQIRRMPGVETAALSTVLPILHPVELLTIVYATEWTHENVGATVRAATPDLMRVLGVRMRSGRFFTEEDTMTGLPVTVVNQTFVNQYLGGGNALGKQIRFGRVPRAVTIVGVIEDVHQDGLAVPSQPEFYLSMTQLGTDHPVYRALLGRFMEVAVRTKAEPRELILELRKGIQLANPHLAIGECTTMAEAVEDSIGAQKLAGLVIGVFGGLVLLITVVGLYGLLSYLVAQRTQEIGIRMALGADRSKVAGLVVRQALLLMVAGTAIGVGLAFASNRLLQRFLFGVSAMDPWTIGLASLGLVTCGVLAAVLPAKRAATINPVEALRTE
jgi:predicted permease